MKYTHRQFCLAQLVIFRHSQAIEIGTLSYKKGHSFPRVCGFVDTVLVIKFDLEPSNCNIFKSLADIEMDEATCFLLGLFYFLEREEFLK